MKSRNLGSNRNGKKHRERKVSPAAQRAGGASLGKFPTFETDERLYTLYIFQEENRKENEDPGKKIVAGNFYRVERERSRVKPRGGESNSSLSGEISSHNPTCGRKMSNRIWQ